MKLSFLAVMSALPLLSWGDARYLKGIVEDDNKTPIAAAVVSVPGYGNDQAVTDSNGIFQVPLDSLTPNGTMLLVVVVKNGFVTFREKRPFSPDDVVRISLHLARSAGVESGRPAHAPGSRDSAAHQSAGANGSTPQFTGSNNQQLMNNGTIGSVTYNMNTQGVEHKEIKIDSKLLDAFVGTYRANNYMYTTVTREGDKLFAQGYIKSGSSTTPQSPKLEMLPESDHKFFSNIVDLQLTFLDAGKDGKASGLIAHEKIQDIYYARVNETVPSIEQQQNEEQLQNRERQQNSASVSCDDGCEVSLRDLPVVQRYEFRTNAYRGQTRETVYKLPENWPPPRFLHRIETFPALTVFYLAGTDRVGDQDCVIVQGAPGICLADSVAHKYKLFGSPGQEPESIEVTSFP